VHADEVSSQKGIDERTPRATESGVGFVAVRKAPRTAEPIGVAPGIGEIQGTRGRVR
jgi:hypothetical protein